MKKTLIFLITLCILNSCETEFSNTYIIKNNTSYDVLITAYDKVLAFGEIDTTLNISKENIVVEANSEFKVLKQAGYHADTQNFFDNNVYDSIVIVFDFEKIITFSCSEVTARSCSGQYNLMNYEDNFVKLKIGKSSGKDEYSYTYTITEEDYSNAEPID